MIIASIAPKIVPGKNPAITALVGNEGQVEERASVGLDLESEEEGEATGVNVAPVVSAVVAVEVDELFEEVAVLEVVLSDAQVLFPWQVYPKGQQAVPHVGREESSLVVLTVFLGCAVAFCSCTSQTIGEM
jgi:hypothetical protein